MHKSALTSVAFGIGGALFGVLVMALALGIWDSDLTTAFTIRGARFPIRTGAIAGFAGGLIGGLVGSRMRRDAAVFVLCLCGGIGLVVACGETVDDRILNYYTVGYGVVLLSIGISTMIANRIAARRRR